MNDPSLTAIQIHDERRVPFREASCSEFFLDVHAHIQERIGPAPEILHDLVCDLIRVDFYPVPPGEGRPWWAVVTSGMSGAPMRVRPCGGPETLSHAELCMLLPPDWPLLDPGSLGARWPLTMMAEIARLPHVYDTWIAPGHTISNGEPPVPYDPDTRFAGAFVTTPRRLSREFRRLRVRGDVTIEFLAVVPLLPGELARLRRMRGPDVAALLDRHEVTELLDPERGSMVG